MKTSCLVLLAALVCMASANQPVPSTKRDCPAICPALYAPVCATNNDKKSKTFDTLCVLNAHNCANPEDAYGTHTAGECKLSSNVNS